MSPQYLRVGNVVTGFVYQRMSGRAGSMQAIRYKRWGREDYVVWSKAIDVRLGYIVFDYGQEVCMFAPAPNVYLDALELEDITRLTNKLTKRLTK